MKNNKRVMYCIVLMVGVGSVDLIFARDQAHMPHNILSACECCAENKNCSLQVGQVILHFSEYPIVNELPSTAKNAHNNHVFFIPASGISSHEARFMMQAANKYANKWYSVSLSLEKKPVPGIKVVLTYDPEKVTMEHAAFDILGSTGACFKFYNKAMLDKLRSSERSLLRVASVAPYAVMA